LSNPSKRGLYQAEVLALRAKAGWNELPDVTTIGPWTILFKQFSNLLIVILLVAAIVALALGEWIDATAIGLIIILNAILGFIQEWRAETALAALRSVLAPKAMVLRDGEELVIPARELVPGDLIVLQGGDNVPADASLLKGVELSVDESILTGESAPIKKHVDADQRIFTGTAIVSGHAEAVVTATGADTEFGQIAQLTGNVEQQKTHLQQHLGKLATQLGVAALAVATGFALLGLAMGRDASEMLMTSLSLAVAMVPEGLPAVVTITLALGAAAMVRRRALVRRLQAVESLGAASVICTDKTGTLTENKMTATSIWARSQSYTVTGTGYDPSGHVERDGQRIRSVDDPVLFAILRAGLFCNHAAIHRRGAEWETSGAPTEAALVTLAYKGWQPLPRESALIGEIPFNSDRKRMTVLYDDQGNGNDSKLLQLMKGAPESVLDVSSDIADASGLQAMTDEIRAQIEVAYKNMAAEGLRVIAVAQRETTECKIREERMTFLGLIGLIDPPRSEVKAAIALTQSARIRVLMITGDSPITARAIASQVGLAATRTITGKELERLDQAGLRQALSSDVIFARTKPADKMRIVSAFQEDGKIVAMTGDGVNDAPALKRADIGIAMGIRGTDVARQASDLVLLDDNFTTIVSAVEEGRRQFGNIRKFVRYLLSSNAGEVVALVASIAIGGPLVFLATQILWMNLVTDGVTAVALGLEKAEPDQMQRPPRDKGDPILGFEGLAVIAMFGLYSGLACLWIFMELMHLGVDTARTTAFCAMVVFEKISVFAFRSLHLPGWKIGWFSNPLLLLAVATTMAAQAAAVYWPPLQALLHTVPIGLSEWTMIALLALPLLVVPELVKTAQYFAGYRTT